jgi:transcriptional regulator with XRE-family HTH domain
MRFTTRRPNPVFSEEYAAIREHIISARRRAGLSQRELASRIGKCHSHITMIERGQRRIDTLELFAIATALGRGPAELFVEVAQRIAAVGRADGDQAG